MSNGEYESNLPSVAIRAMLDRRFREALVENMEQTLAIAGLPLTEEEMAALQALEMNEWDDLSLHAVQQRVGSLSEAGLGRITVKAPIVTFTF